MTIALSLLFLVSGSASGQTDILETPPVLTSDDNYESIGGDVTVFVARPALHAKPLPGLLLIHGEEGLTPRMKELARRLAREEFHVVAPDLLSDRGGTPENPELARVMLEELAPGLAQQNANSAIGYLIALDQIGRELGAVGYGWGGEVVSRILPTTDQMTAAVLINPEPPAVAEVPEFQAMLLIHYTGEHAASSEATAYRQALQSADVTHEIFTYEGADELLLGLSERSELAWSRTIQFLNQILK